MDAKLKAPSSIAWVLGQTGDHGGQYVLSVPLAIIGVGFSVAPYFVVTQIAKALMAGNREPGFYLTRCALMAALWVGRVLCHAFSTTASHKATFAVLGEIRKRCTEKLTHMPLGAVLEQSSGALMTALSTMPMRRSTALSTGCGQVLFRLPSPWSSCRQQWFPCCPSADCLSRAGAFYRRTLLRSSFSLWV